MRIVTKLYDAVYILEGGGLMQWKEEEERRSLSSYFQGSPFPTFLILTHLGGFGGIPASLRSVPSKQLPLTIPLESFSSAGLRKEGIWSSDLTCAFVQLTGVLKPFNFYVLMY